MANSFRRRFPVVDVHVHSTKGLPYKVVVSYQREYTRDFEKHLSELLRDTRSKPGCPVQSGVIRLEKENYQDNKCLYFASLEVPTQDEAHESTLKSSKATVLDEVFLTHEQIGYILKTVQKNLRASSSRVDNAKFEMEYTIHNSMRLLTVFDVLSDSPSDALASNQLGALLDTMGNLNVAVTGKEKPPAVIQKKEITLAKENNVPTMPTIKPHLEETDDTSWLDGYEADLGFDDDDDFDDDEEALDMLTDLPCNSPAKSDGSTPEKESFLLSQEVYGNNYKDEDDFEKESPDDFVIEGLQFDITDFISDDEVEI